MVLVVECVTWHVTGGVAYRFLYRRFRPPLEALPVIGRLWSDDFDILEGRAEFVDQIVGSHDVYPLLEGS